MNPPYGQWGRIQIGYKATYPQTFQISNETNLPLNTCTLDLPSGFINVTPTTGTDVAGPDNVPPTTCSSSMAAGEICKLLINFQPVKKGFVDEQAYYNCVDSNDNSYNVQIGLQGTGY